MPSSFQRRMATSGWKMTTIIPAANRCNLEFQLMRAPCPTPPSHGSELREKYLVGSDFREKYLVGKIKTRAFANIQAMLSPANVQVPSASFRVFKDQAVQESGYLHHATVLSKVILWFGQERILSAIASQKDNLQEVQNSRRDNTDWPTQRMHVNTIKRGSRH